MLRGIRKASSNWLGKTIMAAVVLFLIASFAIWGIGDIFRGFGLSKVAQIGRVEISIEQFRQFYNDHLQQLSRQVGRPITPDQARALGLDRQFLGQLLAEAALDERARQMGLGLTDAEVAKRITSDPSFRGAGGQFDRRQFEALIRQAGFTEPRFVAEQRSLTLRRQLANTVTGELPVPKAELDAVNRFQNEQRAISYVTLDKPQAGDVPAPTPEVLAKYFDERKTLFRAPEYRKLVLLTLSSADLGKWNAVSDADAKKVYDDHHDRYVTPEKRHVLQIVFPKPEEAKAASDKIAAGTAFSAIAAERKLKEQDIDLGLVTKGGIIDKAVADAAFALKEGAVSAPVQGRFGTALVQVVKIEPEKVRSFEEAAPEIKQELSLERGKSEMTKLRDKIEDDRAGGATLAESAAKLKLPSRTIEAIDRSGRAPDGALVDLPAGADILNTAFSTDVGVETDPVPIAGNGLLWYDVAGVTPSRERKLDEVEDQVETRWRDHEIGKRLQAKATEMVDKIKAGGTLEEVAAANQLTVQTAKDLRRNKPTEAVPASVLDVVFRTAKGAVASAEAGQTQQVIFRVTEVTVPPLDAKSDEAKRITAALRNSLADAMLSEYLTHLQSDIGTTINEAALRQAVGGGTPE